MLHDSTYNRILHKNLRRQIENSELATLHFQYEIVPSTALNSNCIQLYPCEISYIPVSRMMPEPYIWFPILPFFSPFEDDESENSTGKKFEADHCAVATRKRFESSMNSTHKISIESEKFLAMKQNKYMYYMAGSVSVRESMLCRILHIYNINRNGVSVEYRGIEVLSRVQVTAYMFVWLCVSTVCQHFQLSVK